MTTAVVNREMTSLAQEVTKVHKYLEALLVATVFGTTVFMLTSGAEHPVVLHFYYVPVVLTGFFRGAYHARLMSLFCILTATIVFLPTANEVATGDNSLAPIFAFMLWAATLVLIAILVGTLSDGWRCAISEVRDAHERDVLTDPLTSAANRRAFEYELDRRLAQWNRDQVPLYLVLLDIDHFKQFNDRYGHQAGDAVLKSVAEVLRQTVREVDLVARYGGEEFALVIAGSETSDVKDIAERARSFIESSRFPYRGLLLRVTASFGVAQIAAGEDVTSLIQRSDAAMYSSKEAGRNCVHFHDGSSCHRFGQGMATETVDALSETGTPTSSDAYTDETTGLPTQKVFFEEFRRRSLEVHRYGGDFTIAIIGIDGLLMGCDFDARTQKVLLAMISRLVGSVLRETDMIARYDANCISILLPATSAKMSLVPLKRLSRDASLYSDVRCPLLSYSVSIGVAEVLAAESPGLTLQRAELALSASIAAGGDSFHVHDGVDCNMVGIDGVAAE